MKEAFEVVDSRWWNAESRFLPYTTKSLPPEFARLGEDLSGIPPPALAVRRPDAGHWTTTAMNDDAPIDFLMPVYNEGATLPACWKKSTGKWEFPSAS